MDLGHEKKKICEIEVLCELPEFREYVLADFARMEPGK